MLKFNNSIVPNKVHIGWHFSSNKYAYRDVYLALEYICLELVNMSALKCSISPKSKIPSRMGYLLGFVWKLEYYKLLCL